MKPLPQDPVPFGYWVLGIVLTPVAVVGFWVLFIALMRGLGWGD